MTQERFEELAKLAGNKLEDFEAVKKAYEDGKSESANNFETKINLLEMERASLLQMLEDIGNELFYADDTGAWYAKADQAPWKHALAKKLNLLFGL